MKASEPSDSRSRHTFLLICALIVAELGFMTLVGWICERPLLTSFGVGLMPMPPSTAVLFLLFGVLLGSRVWTPLSGRAFQVTMAMGWLVALVALLLFVLGCLGVQTPIEYFSLPIAGSPGIAPAGHMSPLSAACFLLASGSFLASPSRSAIGRWRTALALGCAGVLLVVSYVFLLAYFFGAPLLYGGRFIPPALNTILAFITLGLALLSLACCPVGRSSGSLWNNSEAAITFGVIFFLLVVSILSASFIYYRYYEKIYRDQVDRELTTIAERKVRELVQWRKERLGDASILFQNVYFSTLVRRFLEKPEDAEAQQQLQMWAGKFKTHYQADRVSLLDAQGDARLSLPADLTPSCRETLSEAFEALRLGQIRIQDFNRHESTNRVYLAVLVPIFDEADGNRPLGVFVLHVDPTTYLYPLIQRWPTLSRSAETILVRQEGNDVVFLNDLKFKTNTSLNLRVSLKNTGFSAVKAVLGQSGITEGMDYCGCMTVAAVCAVPDSPWFLVARIDTEEVDAPLRERFWQMVAMVSVLFFASGAGVGLVARRQSVQFYQERARSAEALQESQERLNLSLKQSSNVALSMMEDAVAARGRLEKSQAGLESEMAERKRAEVALKDSLNEKEILLREIHHRVKNNLQIIISLLRMQADQETHPTVLAVLEEAQNRVLSMALIHESLYGSENLARVNLVGYVETLCSHLFRSFGSEVARIKLESRLEAVDLELEQAVPCGLILSELVSNALKYAFPAGRAGQITLELRAHAGQVHLRVADNGVGLPPALEIEKTHSLGLRLVFMLAKQLKGAVVVERDAAGVAFQLTFPLPHA